MPLKFTASTFVCKFGKRLAWTIIGSGLQPPLGSTFNCKLKVSVAVKPVRDVRVKYPTMKLGPRTEPCPNLFVFATKVTPVKVKPFNAAVEPKAPLLKAPCVLPVKVIGLPSAEYADIVKRMKITPA